MRGTRLTWIFALFLVGIVFAGCDKTVDVKIAESGNSEEQAATESRLDKVDTENQQLRKELEELKSQTAVDTGSGQAAVKITVITVPPRGGGPGRMERIEGTVTGLQNPSDYRVVIYSLGGSTWYVQPFVGDEFTNIDKSGKWRSRIHLGTEYAVLVVLPTFRPSAEIGKLPVVEDKVIALETVDAK